MIRGRLHPVRTWLKSLGLALLALAFSACMSASEVDRPPTDKPPTDEPPIVNPGGGSDTETLSGTVWSGPAAPAARVALKLIPEDYDPSHPDTALIRRAFSDDTGGFVFRKVDTTRTYNLIAGDAPGRRWALAPGLRAGMSKRAISLSLAKVFLFSMHSEPYAPADSGLAFFPGTDILARCDGATASRVDSVPAGALRFIVSSRAGWQHDTTLAAAADTTKVSAGKSKLIVVP